MTNPKNEQRRAYMRNYMREKRGGRWERKQHQDKAKRGVMATQHERLTAAALMGDPPAGRSALDQVWPSA